MRIPFKGNYAEGDRVRVSTEHKQHAGKEGVVKWIGNYLADVQLDGDLIRTSFSRDEIELTLS